MSGRRMLLLGVFALIPVLIIIGVKAVQKARIPKQETKAVPRCEGCNVLFISIDPLRARNIHAYGYKRPTTPIIDSLAAKGILFKNAISVSSWTLPATMSLFTGVYPSMHKITNKITITPDGKEEISNLKKLSPTIRTIAENFKSNGYITGGFTGGAALHRQFGFSQGFDEYVDDQDFAGLPYSSPKALDWIRKHKNEKLFVLLHGFDTHGQYVPENGYDKRFVDFEYKGKLSGSKEEQLTLREEGLKMGKINLTSEDVRFLTALYDEKLQRMDESLGKFLKEYETLGLLNRTVIVFTSSHGEELYEHGRIDHGHSLYEELIQVPLIFVIPGLDKGFQIAQQVSNIDIISTLLNIVSIKEEEITIQLQGRDLISLMEGNGESQDAFSETEYRYAVFKKSLRTKDGWKIIRDSEKKVNELYNLALDPVEKDELSDKKMEEKESLRKKMEEFSEYNSIR